MRCKISIFCMQQPTAMLKNGKPKLPFVFLRKGAAAQENQPTGNFVKRPGTLTYASLFRSELLVFKPYGV